MDFYSRDFPFGILDVVELLHLKVRRRQPNSIYVDCPFCNDRRGKMNVNFIKNVWRCNYCDEHGGMLDLYAQCNKTTKSDAYWEICDALQCGKALTGYGAESEQVRPSLPLENITAAGMMQEEVPQSQRASAQEVHQTLSLLFGMLSLSQAHRTHLRSPKRGLTDEQIDELGFKSTPPPFLCRTLTERLIKQGCTVQGVPGFYLDNSGRWTVKFYSRISGILIPAVGIDGLLCGAQILLDVPIKDKDDPPDKAGTKYIWFSSSTKNMGVTSGSPVHFVGNPFARTIYVTEGLLKADIAHTIMNRSFAAIAGAGNVQQLDPLFAILSQNGTELIVEAHDMDKFNNKMTSKGASKIYLMARKYGMNCRRLTWNPNYKGIDDWQLALRKEEKEKKEEYRMCFKQRYLYGLSDFGDLEKCIGVWRTEQKGISLAEYLGLKEPEFDTWMRTGKDSELKSLLESQRHIQHFRIYQLEFSGERKTIPFAFLGIKALYKAGYEQPPASDYRVACEDTLICPKDQSREEILKRILDRYNDTLPEDYHGRSVSLSDVVELYSQDERSYFYCDTSGFVQVRFSPFFAKPMEKRDALASTVPAFCEIGDKKEEHL